MTVPASASAGPAGTVLATQAAGPALADGEGTIAFVPQIGTVRVLDAETGASFDADVSAGCRVPPAAPKAVGGGEVLLLCGTSAGLSSPEPRLLDVATRTLHEIAGARQLLEGAALSEREGFEPTGVSFGGVGSVGVGYAIHPYHGGYEGVLDWRMGASVNDEPADRAGQALDLDRPGFYASLCSPMRRTLDPEAEFVGGPAFRPFQFDAPYGISEERGTYTRLVLRRCGSGRGVVLVDSPVRDVQLRSGFVTWDLSLQAVTFNAFAYLPACGVRLGWFHPGAMHVAHVAGSVVLSTAESEESRSWTIRSLAIDDVCAPTTAAWTLAIANGSRIARGVRAADDATLVLPGGTTATRLASRPVRPARLAVRRATTLGLSFGASLRSLSWRLGGGGSHAAAGRGRSWSLRVPRFGRPHTLVLDARFAQGGHARFAVRVRPLR